MIYFGSNGVSVWRIRIRSVVAGAAEGPEPIRVPDQSLAILAMLLERPGELVTREAIQARLWPNGTVVEFEHSVNSAIKRLRQALLDTADAPRFIETLPRKGYRFIGTIGSGGR